ncbi:hypothetical protein [Streptomyces sp. NPDC002537]
MKRRIPYTAAGILAAAALALGATPASAKGVMDIAAPAHPVRTGQTVHVSGEGGDDAARFLRACVLERGGRHGAWHTVGCGRTAASGAWATVETAVRPQHPGVLQLRGVLYGLDTTDDPHPDELRSSPVTTVRVN